MDPVTLAPSDRLDEGLLEWADGLGVQGLKTVADFLESYQNKVCTVAPACKVSVLSKEN